MANDILMNMSTDRAKKIASSDRSMEATGKEGGELFFFPKRRPPVSVRAKTIEEARAKVGEPDLAEETNPTQV